MLASLALHALILLCLASFRNVVPARPAPPPITAHLAKLKPPPEPPKVEPQLPQPVARSIAKPQPRLAPVPTPVLSVEPSKQAVEPPALVVPAVPLQPVAPAQPPARAEVPPASASAASGPDPGSIARFRLEMMEAALRYERYPRLARDNNWEGRVELRILIAENGALAGILVRKSSGHAVLDDQALSMLRSAHPNVAMPSLLRGKAFTLDIPVDFSIKDQGR